MEYKVLIGNEEKGRHLPKTFPPLYTPELYAIAEPPNRIMTEDARSMLIQANLSHYHTAYC